MVFDLTNPDEAKNWKIVNHDSTKGTSNIQPTGLFIASRGSQPAYIERDVVIPTGRCNRVMIKLRGTPDVSDSGFIFTNFSFAREQEILDQSTLERIVPENNNSIAVFRLDQSVLWQETIRKVRFSPLQRNGQATIQSFTFDLEVDESPIPIWDFLKPESLIGWDIGEYMPTGFIARAPHQNFDGITVQIQGNSLTIQNNAVNLPASMIDGVELIFKNQTGQHTQAFFRWSYNGPHGFVNNDDCCVVLPVKNDPQSWQRLKFPLSNNPFWKGNPNAVMFVPINTKGQATIRGIRFYGKTGLGQEGNSRSLVTWKTHQDVSIAIRQGNYKPLLVLVTKSDNPFSKKIENQLALNQDFLQLVKQFHPVRIEYEDPVTDKTFGKVYRIPMLVLMYYNKSTGQWSESTRLSGQQVSDQAVNSIQTFLNRP